MKAEGVCRLALPRVRTCLPFEEGVLHSCTSGYLQGFTWFLAPGPHIP